MTERVVSARTWIGRYYWITNEYGEMIMEIGYCHDEMNESFTQKPFKYVLGKNKCLV